MVRILTVFYQRAQLITKYSSIIFVSHKRGKASGVSQHPYRTGDCTGFHQLVDLLRNAANMVMVP